MSKHKQLWTQAAKDLKTIYTCLSANQDELVKEYEGVTASITKFHEDLKNQAQEDKHALLQELQYLNQRELELRDRLDIARENAGSPYFSKVVSDEGFYISKHFTDLDNNIIKYTAPIAALRYKDIGEMTRVNGFPHQVKEKQILTIQDGNLLELSHEDGEGALVCDEQKFRQLEEEIKEIPVAKAAMKIPEIPMPVEPKKYVLGEIIAKMREEQDTVMRAPYNGVTLIKGAAGSGKTNIAFHRIVFLTSEHPQEFRQENIAVFCFNVALKQYLFNMLAELNISRVKVFSMDDWFYSTLREYTNIGWLNFKEDSHLKHVKTRIEVVDILEDFFHEYSKQLQQAVNLEEHAGETQVQIDAYRILNMLYTHQPFLGYIGCKDNYSRGRYKPSTKVDASDQYILAWLVQRITGALGINCFGQFDHIVVDEVQDLMPIQMALINQLHNNSMTIVGDVTQKIFESGIDSWDQFNISINQTYELTMCHRSTLQTVLFANELISKEGDKVISTKVGKQGDKPLVFIDRNRTAALAKTVETVKQVKEQDPKASVAVVSYRNFDLKWIHGELAKAGLDAYIATRKDWDFSSRIAVTTYHQIKGLEFDYVFVLGLNDYLERESEIKDRVIYTVVTRAQKRVFVTCVKELPAILQGVDPDLYQRE